MTPTATESTSHLGMANLQGMSISVLASVVEWLIGVLMDLSSEELRNGPITVPSKRRFEDTTSSLFNRGFTAVTGSLKTTSPKKEQLDTWLKPKIQKTEARNGSRFRKVSTVGRTRSQQGTQHCPIAAPFSTTNSDSTFLYQLREQNVSSQPEFKSG